MTFKAAFTDIIIFVMRRNLFPCHATRRSCFRFLDKRRAIQLSLLGGNAANIWNGIMFPFKLQMGGGNQDVEIIPSLCFCRYLHPSLGISYLCRIIALFFVISLSHGEQIYFAFHLQVHNNARRALQGQKNQLLTSLD